MIVTDKLASYQAGAPRADAVGAASPVEVPEQPRRELSPADPAPRAGEETLQVDPARATVPVRVQRHLAALSAASAPAVGGRLPPGDGRWLRGLQRDHRRDDHGRRLNRRLGQDVSSKPTAHHPESSHRPIRLAQVDNASASALSRSATFRASSSLIGPAATGAQHTGADISDLPLFPMVGLGGPLGSCQRGDRHAVGRSNHRRCSKSSDRVIGCWATAWSRCARGPVKSLVASLR